MHGKLLLRAKRNETRVQESVCNVQGIMRAMKPERSSRLTGASVIGSAKGYLVWAALVLD